MNNTRIVCDQCRRDCEAVDPDVPNGIDWCGELSLCSTCYQDAARNRAKADPDVSDD